MFLPTVYAFASISFADAAAAESVWTRTSEKR